MTPVLPPVRLCADGSEAPASLRSALSAAARHQPTSEEIAQLALSLSPLLKAPALTSVGRSSPSQPSVGAPHSAVHSAGSGWAMGTPALFLAGTAALLLSLPRMWNAMHPSDRPASEGSAITASQTSERIDQKLAVPAPPSVEPGSLPSVSPPSPGPARESRTKPRSSASGVGAPTATPAAPAAETQESEAQLLERARRLLQTNPRQTLDLVREHERRFASGVLVQEREVVAIDALERLGRGEEARTRLESFRARYPSSVHGKRVEVPSGRP